jgi:hypothetical protein
MLKVILQFPDTRLLADFVIYFRTNNSEVNTPDRTWTGYLPPGAITTATKKFGATIKQKFETDKAAQ